MGVQMVVLVPSKAGQTVFFRFGFSSSFSFSNEIMRCSESNVHLLSVSLRFSAVCSSFTLANKPWLTANFPFHLSHCIFFSSFSSQQVQHMHAIPRSITTSPQP